MDEIFKILDSEKKQSLILNNHCQICEFKNICIKNAFETDSLSLLKGIKEKEINKLNNKGIFSDLQLSYRLCP